MTAFNELPEATQATSGGSDGGQSTGSAQLPGYPKPTAPITGTVRITRDRTFSMWVGKADAITRLADVANDAMQRAYGDFVATLALDAPSRVAQATERVSDLTLKNEVTASGGRVKRSGNLKAILAELDVRDIEKIAIGNSTYRSIRGQFVNDGTYPTIAIEFSKGGDIFDDSGTRIQVAGSDRQWVGGTFDTLVTEINRDVPWWRFIGRPYFATIIFLFVAFGLGGIFKAFNSVGYTIVFSFPVVLIAIFITVIPIQPRIFRRVVPPFDVIEPGRTGRAPQLLATTITVLGFLIALAGLIVSLKP